jgi:hypothetical protein
MAIANSTLIETSQYRLNVTEYSWGKIYQGTKADLIAAGLAKLEWFPGQGTAKTATRIGMIDGEMKVLPLGRPATREQEEKGLVKIFHTSKYVFQVRITYNQEYLDREKLKREVEKQHAEKKQSLDSLPKSGEEFSGKRHQILREMLGPMFNQYFCRADGGYHYSRDVIEKARELVHDLLDLAEEGQVYFDKKRYQYSLNDIEERDIKAHPEFSAFMAATLAIGKAAAIE